jgi:hypothetical protein
VWLANRLATSFSGDEVRHAPMLAYCLNAESRRSTRCYKG